MALSDWYTVKDNQVQGGANILNIYHVVKLNPAFLAADIAEAFEDSIFTSLLNEQHTSLTHSIIEVENWVEPTDFATRVPSPNVGVRVGQALTQFNACTVQFNRKRTDMKNGQKRFAVGNEADGDGDQWEATILAEMAIVATKLMASWEKASAPGVGVCDFGIVKRVCVGDPPPDPCVKYRLPVEGDPLIFYIPDTALVRAKRRSQVSRKVLV